jgi:Asp/Glu/hydantoin racemase
VRIKVIRPASRQNTDPEFMALSARIAAGYGSPGTEIDTVFLDAGAHGGPMAGHINEARIMAGARHVVHEVVKAEREGWDAVFLTGEYDVGAEIARHLVRIPVVDIGTVAARFAPLVGDRVGMLVVERSLLSYTRKLLARWRLADAVAAMATWEIPLYESWPRRGEVKARTIEICRALMAAHDVDVILPFCAVFVPFLANPREIEDAIGIPVLDTVAVGIRTTEMFVSLGIRKNQKTHPDTPPEVWGE